MSNRGISWVMLVVVVVVISAFTIYVTEPSKAPIASVQVADPEKSQCVAFETSVSEKTYTIVGRNVCSVSVKAALIDVRFYDAAGLRIGVLAHSVAFLAVGESFRHTWDYPEELKAQGAVASILVSEAK